ncbi:toxin-antitoxin system YwqK family antitoxin [Longitalea arenae]|uniref:toxin-antitoxin system YwqK family antitoxin n=1 Tax=Longitalea arenae TaxID=2812558 RepID=UPI001967DBA5|nr:hypothetical protein [Longitalea arenae]
MKLIVFPVLLLISGNACKTGQELDTAPLNRVVLNKSDTIYQFYTIKPTPRKPQLNASDYYYWFRADTVLVTRNGFDGKLLHGEYRSFYPNKNLKESGQFEYGLKSREWKSWFSNGELQSITNWRAGKKEGKFQEFSPDGQRLRSGQYKEDQLWGNITRYSADTIAGKQLYRAGQPVVEKVRTDSTKKRSKHAAQP